MFNTQQEQFTNLEFQNNILSILIKFLGRVLQLANLLKEIETFYAVLVSVYVFAI